MLISVPEGSTDFSVSDCFSLTRVFVFVFVAGLGSCRWRETMSLNYRHQRASCSPPAGWYMSMKPRWNDTDRVNRISWRKTCLSANLPTTNPTWTDPGRNPGLRGERSMNNGLSHARSTWILLSLWSELKRRPLHRDHFDLCALHAIF
jgi:hypothetical protein